MRSNCIVVAGTLQGRLGDVSGACRWAQTLKVFNPIMPESTGGDYRRLLQPKSHCAIIPSHWERIITELGESNGVTTESFETAHKERYSCQFSSL